MIFKGKVVKTEDDFAFVLVDDFEQTCGGNCAKCAGICPKHKPVWKTVNKANAHSGDAVKVNNIIWKGFIGKLPEVVGVEG